jgi:catechol 2,3-dioxygenase-like lactoylglutathione lyase family enzyme
MESKSENTVPALKAHLALNVRNVQTSLEFYRKMLNIEPSKVRTGYAKFDVQNPPLNLTLNEVAFKDKGALSHLGIQVASTADVLAMRDRWGASGLITRDEMQTNCCYATQDKTWVNDPDGNEWEVFVVLKDNLPETAACCGIEAVGLQDLTGITKTSATGSAAVEAVSCCGTPASQSENA